MAKKRKRKRTPPSRKVATMKDVNSARNRGRDEAVLTAWAIIFTVMRDKHGWGARVRLPRLWNEVNELSDSIAKGYVKLEDLIKALEEACGLILEP